MKRIFMMLLFCTFACGPKKESQTSPDVDAPAESTPHVEEIVEQKTETVEEEPLPPAFPSNVNFQAMLTFADGSTKEGHVIRLERSETFEGTDDRAWFEDEKKLRIELSTAAGGWQQTFWKDISEIEISVPRFSRTCVYSSDWIPWLYSCAVATKSTAKTKDGKMWNVDTKYKYKMYFETEDPQNPEEIAFWLNTHRSIQQDEKEVSLGSSNPENNNLYLQLQKQLQSEIQSTMVTKIILK